jgi:hypothetical protein
MTKAIYQCRYCGTIGVWPPGPPDVCPTCQESPALRNWHTELASIRSAMLLAAETAGCRPGNIAMTPEIRARFDALGPQPGPGE